MRLNNIFLFLLSVTMWGLPSQSASGQNRIFGRLTDATTGEPVAFASVFFSNTTFGSSTDQDGVYKFSGFPPGKYDLTVSYVGYQLSQVPVEFTENVTLEHDMQVQQVILLNEILIKPDTINWERNFKDFKGYFLGSSRYAKEAVIQNPRDLHLYYDDQTKTLVAHAKRPIVIENRATGYRMHYHLSQFEFNGTERVFKVHGLPQFEQLVPKSLAQEKRWEKARANIYYGSLLHFMRSWLDQTWKKDGFKVSRMYRMPNKERPSEEYLSTKIAALRKELVKKGQPLVVNTSLSNNGKTDSLSYYIKLRSLPVEVDSIVQEKLSGAEFTDASNRQAKTFSGILKIEYKEKEDPDYAALVGRAQKRTLQRSNLLVQGPLTLYSNGYYEDIRMLFMEDYWSWSERVSTMLPLDYKPTSTNKK